MNKTIVIEKQKNRAQRYYEKNRILVIERTKQYYKDNREKVVSYKLYRSYGITLIEYNELLRKQDGVCAICKNKEIIIDKRTGLIRSLAVDHNHDTGVVRGLLCRNCNTLLGCLRENQDNLDRLIQYLK